MTNFSSLGLQGNLLQAIDHLGFETPSDVQKQSIPILLEQKPIGSFSTNWHW